MKKLLTLLFTGAFLCASFMAKAQDELESGFPTPASVVEAPLAYRDILRTNSQGWIRENFITGQGIWRNYERVVSSKDIFGGFSELSTAYWDTLNGFWKNNYSTVYDNIYNSNNLIDERVAEVSYNGGAYATKAIYFYDTNLKEKQIDFYYKTGSSFFKESSLFILYNADGTKRADSSVRFNPARSVVTFYTYDNNGRCIERLERNIPKQFGIDTVSQNLYVYNNNGQLQSKTFFYNSFTQPFDRRDYTYTQEGKIDKVFWWYTINNNLTLLGIYGHYYTASKLNALTSHYFNAGQENYGDSIILNYLPNGQYDTAHIYRAGQTPTSWAATPTDRMIFEPNNTSGIRGIKQSVTALTAYPNPATNVLFVALEAATSGSTNLILTDMAGRVLKTEPIVFFAGQTLTTQLPLDSFAPGIYMLQAGGRSIKVIKQ